MFTTKKIAIVSVINDLATDHRVNKTCNVLYNEGFEVVLIGRKLKQSPPLPDWPFRCIRMKLLFSSGPLFYIFFNCNLFFKLLFLKGDLLYANDLDTLLPNYIVSKIKRLPLIYDSHELFCEVPELKNSPFKQKVWLSLEKWLVPNLQHAITVNKSIASILKNKYGVKFDVVRNIADTPSDFKHKSKKELHLPEDKAILILQGAGINMERGAEELVLAMQWVNKAFLLIIGSGDVWEKLEQLVKEKKLGNRIKLIRKLPKDELMHYTFCSDLGISIDKPTNLNYLNSLPNKVFDYLHAGVPLLASRLPEIESIIEKYEVGVFIDNHQPEHIAERINSLIDSSLLVRLKHNTLKASQQLNWQTEKQELIKVIHATNHTIKR